MPYSAHLLFVVQFVGTLIKLKGSIKNWPVNPGIIFTKLYQFLGNEVIGLWHHEDFRPIHIEHLHAPVRDTYEFLNSGSG